MKKFYLFLVVFIPLKILACECGIHKLSKWQKMELNNSECIFIGEVIEINSQDNLFTIKVIESIDGGDEIGNIYYGKNWDTCHPYVANKGKWIVYGFSENGFLRLNQCGISRSFENPLGNPSIIQLSDKANSEESRIRAQKDLELEIVALRQKLASR